MARIALARTAPLLAAYGRPLRDVEVTEDHVAIDLAPPASPAALLDRSAVAIARHVLRETVSDGILVELRD